MLQILRRAGQKYVMTKTCSLPRFINFVLSKNNVLSFLNILSSASHKDIEQLSFAFIKFKRFLLFSFYSQHKTLNAIRSFLLTFPKTTNFVNNLMSFLLSFFFCFNLNYVLYLKLQQNF